MIEIFVWLPQGDSAFGHASLRVRGHTYISWWPTAPQGGVPHPHTIAEAATALKTNYPSHANPSFEADKKAEKGRDPVSEPPIFGLNEMAIINWWHQFASVRQGKQLPGPLPAWRVLDQNCAAVVAMALTIGGGQKYASWSKSHHMVWKPTDVLAYARAIRAGFLKKGARRVLHGW